MKLYVAGPMRGYDEFNFPAFDKAAEHLRSLGHGVFSPAEHDRDLHGDDFGPDNAVEKGFDLRAALAADTSWIAGHADGVAVLDGWKSSSGARAEVALAHALNLIVAPVDAFLDTDGSFSYDGEPDSRDWIEPEGKTLATVSTCEVRTTSSSGGEKGSKPARFDLLPAKPLWQVAELYGKGAEKYADRNWELGYEWSKSYAAMQRHAWLFWQGVDLDDETGAPHLASVVFHALAMLEWATTHPEFDDRVKP